MGVFFILMSLYLNVIKKYVNYETLTAYISRGYVPSDWCLMTGTEKCLPIQIQTIGFCSPWKRGKTTYSEEKKLVPTQVFPFGAY